MDWESPPPDFAYVLFDRTEPAKDAFKFYHISWQRNLFAEWVVVRQFGRKGVWQRTVANVFPSLDQAWPFIRALIKARLRHGYQVIAPERYRNVC